MTAKSVTHRRTGRPVSADRITAFHEAGHAVIAEALGLHVYSAKIEHEDSDDEGCTTLTSSFGWCVDWLALYTASLAVPPGLVTLRPPGRLSKKQRAQLDADVTVACAGLAAESVLLGGRASQNWDAEANVDRVDAEGAAAMLGLTPRQARALVLARCKAVQQMLKARWPEVEAVAALLRRKRRRAASTWREAKGPELRLAIRKARA